MKLTNLLEQRSEHKGLSHTVQSARVCARYEQVIGQSFPQVGETEAVKIERGMLTVTASSPAQASFLRLHEEEIITQVNQHLADEAWRVERLMFEIRS